MGVNKLDSSTNLPGLFVKTVGLITEGVQRIRINSGSKRGHGTIFSTEIVADYKWIWDFRSRHYDLDDGSDLKKEVTDGV